MASNIVTKEIESRIKQSPEHLFNVFLEISEPVNDEPPQILIKYPNDFSGQILNTATIFAYPCQIVPDNQSEHFTFVVLDSTGSTFLFGYCRRSCQESTCLCFISYYPWFDLFYNILNDLSQIVNSKSVHELDLFLSSLYNYKLMPIEQFYRNEGKETIEIAELAKTYSYSRPDQRKLPSMLSNRTFTVMFSQLGPDIMLQLFSHLIFERRIIFVSSKLFHLTACVCGCLYLINPMHWQSIFLPILPESMSWTAQCTAPFIIGIHSSTYSKMDKRELGDAVIININEKKIYSPHDDLSLFPKHLLRSMKKGIEQSSQLIGDHLSRVFLRAMAFIIGNYADGFVMKNGKVDFDRDVYLQQYQGTDLHGFMFSVVNTQMFEQFSRYRTQSQFEREIDIDEFDIEVKNFEQSRKSKNNKKIYKILERSVTDPGLSSLNCSRSSRTSFINKLKAANPLLEQVQSKAEKLQTAFNKTGQKLTNEASTVKHSLKSLDTNENVKEKPIKQTESKFLTVDESNSIDLLSEQSSSSSRSSTIEQQPYQTNSLIDLDIVENSLLPTPIVLNVIEKPKQHSPTRQIFQIDSKIKQLQNELKQKVQTFDKKSFDPRREYTDEQKQIKRLVAQFDPYDNSNKINSVLFRSDIHLSDRHPSIQEIIPSNYVSNILKTIHTNYGTNNVKTNDQTQEVASSTTSTSDINILESTTNDFVHQVSSSETNQSNLIDFD